MGTLADVYVTVHGKTDALSAETRVAAGIAGREAGSEFGGGFSSMLKSAVVGVGAILAGSGLLALGTMGIKAAADMQQAQVAFTTLIGNASQAKTFLSDLQKFAAATPFELPGLVDDARLLLGVGVAAKDVIPKLTAWGNAAGALGISGDRFNNALLAVAQSMGAGKINAQDMNQLINAGIPIWKLMSEATGKTVAQLRDMSAAGTLLSADVLPKVEAQMNKDYGGAMTAQSMTLNGVWSTFMDNLRNGLSNSVQPLIPILSVAVPKAADLVASALSRASAVMKDFISQFGTGWTKGARDGAGEVQQIGNVAHEVFEWLAGPGVQALRQVVGGLREIVDATADVVRWLNAHRTAAEVIGGVLLGLIAIERTSAAVTFITSGALLAKVTAISAVRGAIVAYNVVQAIANSALWTWIGVQAIDFAAWVAKAARVVVATAALVAHIAIMGAVKVATIAWTAVQWLLNVALDANPIGLIVLAIAALVAAVIWIATKTTWFQTIWSYVWDFLKAVGAWFAGPFANFFVAAWNWIVAAFVAARDWIASVILAIIAKVQYWQAVFQAVIEIIRSAWDAAWAFVVGVIQAAINKVAAVIVGIQSAVNRVVGFFSSMVSGVSGQIGNLISFVTGIPGRITGALGNLGSLLAGAGRDIVNGLVNGIEGAWHFVTDKVNALVNVIPAKVRSILGISSPSKVMAEIGFWVPAGLAKGIDSYGPVPLPVLGAGAITSGRTSGATTVQAGTAAGTSTTTSAVSFAPTYNMAQPVDPATLAKMTVNRLLFALGTGAS